MQLIPNHYDVMLRCGPWLTVEEQQDLQLQASILIVPLENILNTTKDVNKKLQILKPKHGSKKKKKKSTWKQKDFKYDGVIV